MREQPALLPGCAEAVAAGQGAAAAGIAAAVRRACASPSPGSRSRGMQAGIYLTALRGEREGLVKAHPSRALAGSPESESNTKTNPGLFISFPSRSLVILSRVMVQQSNEAALSKKK